MTEQTSFQPHHTGSPAGPFIQFRGELKKNHLGYTILGVFPAYLSTKPTLEINIINISKDKESIKISLPVNDAILLDVVCGFSFWRFSFEVKQHEIDEQLINYTVSQLPPGQFRVPSITTNWRYAFYSCNGYSSGVSKERLERYKKSSPLWCDVLNESKNDKGLHLLIGGGDQLYFDSLWSRVPGLKEWASLADIEIRKNSEFVSETDVLNYYLDTYLVGFTSFGVRESLSNIPTCMSWDDHDIFDGWGSYPEYLHNSKTFQGIFKCSKRLYMLFQLHTNNELSVSDGFIGSNGGLSMILQCGENMAVVLPDTRTERSLNSVLSPESWSLIFQKISKLNSNTKQLLFIAPIPMIYPHSKSTGLVKAVSSGFLAMSNALGSIQNLCSNNKSNNSSKSNTSIIGSRSSALHSVGLFKTAVNIFGEPELLDDLQDHWTVPEHQEERANVIRRLQLISEHQRLRVTILSGDVHLAAAGVLYTNESSTELATSIKSLSGSRGMSFLKIPQPEDHRFMLQIVSSGIGNLPPPPVVANNLAGSTKEMRFDRATCERMIDIFEKGIDGTILEKAEFYLRRRNWALGTMTQTGMDINICAEKEKGLSTGETTRFKLSVVNMKK